jgi:hypothetical protein
MIRRSLSQKARLSLSEHEPSCFLWGSLRCIDIRSLPGGILGEIGTKNAGGIEIPPARRDVPDRFRVPQRQCSEGRLRQRYADAGGPYLGVTTTGAKLGRLRYRYAGKEKHLALGYYPGVSLASARKGRAMPRGGRCSLAKTFSVPKRPGWVKSNSDHRSESLFSTGVPVSATRDCAFSLFTWRVCFAPRFLIVKLTL